MRNSSYHLVVLTLIAMLDSGCTGSTPGPARPPTTSSPQARATPKPAQREGIPPEQLDSILTEHDRGLGLIERQDYKRAVEAFRKVHDLAPRWIPSSINLAIALVNQNGLEGRSGSRALQLLDEVIARDPDNLHAHYCRGLIYEKAGLLLQAHAEFRTVAEKDPSDALAWYMLGSTVDVDPSSSVPEGDEIRPIEARLDEQISDFKKALERNPHLSAAVYRLAHAYLRKGDRDESKKLFDHWKQLEGGRVGIRRRRTGPGDQGRYARVIDPLARPRRDEPVRKEAE
jgi:tetratricopeptide (TPR) repeat protein